MIKTYQVFLSSFSMPSCKYLPSCSCYAQESVTKFGSVKGLILTFFRIIKCHPFAKGGYDPVPESFCATHSYSLLRGSND